ncbi:MAG: O-antigen ligase family protein [candidate division Zixibacteria bacterium]|nr:O-antigen ligase family protein [candidate division Zixibacteria bacterium]MCI0595794.1 O-antigen ligase family protein [candidate division Zixibacteria bacterium]
MEPLPFTYNTGANRSYLFLAVAVSLSCVGLFLWRPVSLAVVLGAVFAGLFFSSRTLRWIVFPAVLIFNQFLIRNAGVPYMIGGLAIQPIDWIAILLILTVLLNWIFTGSRFRMQTGLEIPIWTFLGIIVVSLFNAPDLKAGVVNWGHTGLYFIAFYAMVVDWKDVPLERIWRSYFLWALLAALSALGQFFESGGGRSLGLAGIPLNHLIIPVLCFELSRLSIGEKSGRWWVVAVFVATATATQTRGLWLMGGVLLAVWIFSGYFLSSFRPLAARRLNTKVVGIILLLFLLFLALLPFLAQVERRATQLVEQGGTVYLRLFLWGVALKFFLSHPITGIGMGQFAGAMEQFPEMKNLAVFEWTHGLSAHNVLLTFLAETGLVGTLAFLLLLVSAVRFAWKGVRSARTLEELGWGWGFFMLFTVFAISFLFAGTWHYEFAFPLALLVLFVRNLETSRGG